MDNSRPPAWVLVKGPDGKLFSHLEWPKAGIIKHVKATSQCTSRDMHVKVQWEMQHLGYLHSNVHNDNQEGQGIRRHIMVQ